MFCLQARANPWIQCHIRTLVRLIPRSTIVGLISHCLTALPHGMPGLWGLAHSVRPRSAWNHRKSALPGHIFHALLKSNMKPIVTRDKMVVERISYPEAAKSVYKGEGRWGLGKCSHWIRSWFLCAFLRLTSLGQIKLGGLKVWARWTERKTSDRHRIISDRLCYWFM